MKIRNLFTHLVVYSQLWAIVTPIEWLCMRTIRTSKSFLCRRMMTSLPIRTEALAGRKSYKTIGKLSKARFRCNLSIPQDQIAFTTRLPLLCIPTPCKTRQGSRVTMLVAQSTPTTILRIKITWCKCFTMRHPQARTDKLKGALLLQVATKSRPFTRGC